MRQHLVVLITTVVICFGIMEAVSRVFLKEWWDSDSIRSRTLSLKEYMQPSDNANLLYELKHNATVKDRYGVQYDIGNDGRRIHWSCWGYEDGLKVAVIGDSTSFGWGVEHNQSYPALIERLLNQSGTPAEVRNFSVPGYNTEQEREVYRSRVRAWQPDIVIIHHDGNDADPIGRYFYEDCRDPDYGNNWAHSALVKVMVRVISGLRYDDGIPKDTEILNYSIASGPILDNHIQYLFDFVKEIQTDGAKCYVLMWDAFTTTGDTKDLIGYRKLHLPYLQRCAYKDMLIDPYFDHQRRMTEQGKVSSDYWVSPTDAHPNAEMHQMLADYIVERIKP